MSVSPADQYVELKGDVVEMGHRIASLLHCDVNKQILALSLMLIEKGVHPESVADVIMELRTIAATVRP